MTFQIRYPNLIIIFEIYKFNGFIYQSSNLKKLSKRMVKHCKTIEVRLYKISRRKPDNLSGELFEVA